MLLMDEAVNPSREAPYGVQALASAFASKWKGYRGTEIGNYQGHFNEICEIVGYEKPADDLDNHDFEFQHPAPTPGDRRGTADVWLRDHFVMEYKKRGKRFRKSLRSGIAISR